MEIVVLVLGIVGFVMSWVIVGAVPALLAIIFGGVRFLVKKRLSKLGKVEMIIGMVAGILAILVSVYVYLAGIMDVDFVKVVREFIDGIVSKFPF